MRMATRHICSILYDFQSLLLSLLLTFANNAFGILVSVIFRQAMFDKNKFAMGLGISLNVLDVVFMHIYFFFAFLCSFRWK